MDLKARPPVKLEDSQLVSCLGQNTPRILEFPKRFFLENTSVFSKVRR
ncbi:hypothetical protein HYS54_00535 [Candidatus Micrarchaeota archaeon]|nr:hypothetical protein [Candidatus Micrarchaeota archaeon]